MSDSNYIFEKGTFLVAPGGGGAMTPFLPGTDGQALKSDSTAPLGMSWVSTLPGEGDVVGPGSSTAHNLASFANTSGKVLEDSGIAKGSVVIGASSVVDGNLASYNGTTGKLLADSGIKASGVMQVIRSVPVDMTAAASTLLFTPGADFIVTQIIAVITSLTGSLTDPTVNIGFTSTGYADFVSGLTLAVVNQGDNEQLIPIAATTALPLSPSGQGIYVNVTAPDSTASVNLTRFDIIGYYY